MNYGKIIGVGNTATVYEWEKGKVLKLFYDGYPKDAVEKEFYNATIMQKVDISSPKVYETVNIDNRLGIIYEKVEGESLTDWVIRTGNVQECAKYMAKLHIEILQNKADNVTDYKGILRRQILRIPTTDKQTDRQTDKQTDKTKEEALQILDTLPNGNILCHGDFHPGNIIISEGKTVVVDFMNVCRGNRLYDIARTVFLVQYTPIPDEVEDKQKLMWLKKTIADLYLTQMNVTREEIQEFLEVIMVARLGE